MKEFDPDCSVDSVQFEAGKVTIRICSVRQKSSRHWIWQDFHSNTTIVAGPWCEKVDRALERFRRVIRDRISEGDKSVVVQAQWTYGSGVSAATNSENSSDPEVTELRAHETFLTRRLQIGLWVTLISVGVIILAFFYGPKSIPGVSQGERTPFFIALLLAWVMINLGNSRLVVITRDGIRRHIQHLEAASELNRLLDTHEKRAYRLFELSNVEINRYYNQALSQRKYAFYLGVFCLVGGFAVVGVALYILYKSPQLALGEKIVIAALGCVSALLANFVAVIFLRMFSAVVQSMVDFHRRMVSTHHVYLSNLMIASIRDEAVRNETLARLVLAAAKTDDQDGNGQTAPKGNGETDTKPA
jgi:hypothetical protein